LLCDLSDPVAKDVAIRPRKLRNAPASYLTTRVRFDPLAFSYYRKKDLSVSNITNAHAPRQVLFFFFLQPYRRW
jgi:hypothetical protein